ncbi:hypothetical protein QAD02_018343 [Eretmocerus hayati]|uniref:Uncharacterized protein n=1 Tax=Eretmocerus hayati TaxID=131215 RepID=A0ACC2PGF7_9HYME|nr:hypothetical protein QAD02_018343 [Eretmocerus hayati]
MYLQLCILLFSFAHIKTHEDVFERHETNRLLAIRRRWSYEENVIVRYSEKIPNNTFSFATCKYDKYPRRVSCDVSTKQLDDNWYSKGGDTCTIAFVPCCGDYFTSNDFNPKYASLNYLKGSNKILLSWNETNGHEGWIVHKIEIIDMAMCNRTNLRFLISHDDPTVPIDKTLQLVIYDNRFDVIVFQNDECFGSKWCKISYDEYGQKIGEQRDFPLDLIALNLTLTEPLPFTEEIYAYGVLKIGNGSKILAFRILPDRIIELETNITSSHSILVPLVSIANNTILICGKHPESDYGATPIHCHQYTNQSTKPTFDHMDAFVNHVVSVHGLTEDGIIFFALDYSSNDFVYYIVKWILDDPEKKHYYLQSPYALNHSKNVIYAIQTESSSDLRTKNLCVQYTYLSPCYDIQENCLMQEKLCLKGRL